MQGCQRAHSTYDRRGSLKTRRRSGKSTMLRRVNRILQQVPNQAVFQDLIHHAQILLLAECVRQGAKRIQSL